MKIFEAIQSLVQYAIDKNLIENLDSIYIRNKIIQALEIDDFQDTDKREDNLEKILEIILNYACEKGLIQDNIIERDLFDAKIMGILIDRPSQIIKEFWEKYEKSPKMATDFYYELSKNSNYIKTYRIAKDIKWKFNTDFGELDITINLSKPEKDPKDIAKISKMERKNYPKCELCKENEGYAGRLNFPARQNHRIIPIKICGNDCFFQYSPYVYYNEHCIVFNCEHTPMKINDLTFAQLLDFVKIFPHYVVGSNTDLPITGGSILSHEHYQGGNYHFPLAKAIIEKKFIAKGFEDIEFGIVKWPMAVLRLSSDNSERLVQFASKILSIWKEYFDEENFIFAKTEKGQHNTITPIARKNKDKFELDLILRNNITTDEYPLGVFHPHKELHNIKKENIGLIEVMGLAVLPARLKNEMKILKEYILLNKNIDENENIKKHSHWVKSFIGKYTSLTNQNIDGIIEDEIGNIFLRVLEDASVFKRSETGQKGFEKFINKVIG